MISAFIQDIISQLHSTLISYLALENAEKNWDPTILTEALVIFLFTLNQDVQLDRTYHIVSD